MWGKRGQGASRGCHRTGDAATDWDDGARPDFAAMYTDWTAVILLLLTAVPLLAVVATATFFIWQQKKKQIR
jgi:hypothetical protein